MDIRPHSHSSHTLQFTLVYKNKEEEKLTRSYKIIQGHFKFSRKNIQYFNFKVRSSRVMFILCKDFIKLYELRRAYFVPSKAFKIIINLDKGLKITNACPIFSCFTCNTFI